MLGVAVLSLLASSGHWWVPGAFPVGGAMAPHARSSQSTGTVGSTLSIAGASPSAVGLKWTAT
ncbi:MAG TPA: hypothetical protein VGS23_03065, partial [Thermoplasmata archaeon]|nr:hypothetical protein [Thermoplasmata archaeon]